MTSPGAGYWPLPLLRLRPQIAIGSIELRLPDADDLAALAALAEDGVHDPAVQPFGVPWTDEEPEVRALSTMQYHWGSWASWTPRRWELNLVTALDGTVVGMQALSATEFAVLREVSTGSWIGLEHQGLGIGTAMRAAILALAFDGLGAEQATSSAFTDNPASLAVSRKLGYADDGIARQVSRGRPAQMQRLRLDRRSWLEHRHCEVIIEGLEPCLPLFGAG
jgi:RimJ/RimL family protein N-acetyltransferase